VLRRILTLKKENTFLSRLLKTEAEEIKVPELKIFPKPDKKDTNNRRIDFYEKHN